MAMSPEMATSVKLGIECCRRGDWNAGLQYLGKVTQTEDASVGLPGLFYSYLGYGIALRDRRIREGLRLCRHSIEVELFEATDGREGGTLDGRPVVILTTIGAKTGSIRKNPIMRIKAGGCYAAVASNAGAARSPCPSRGAPPGNGPSPSTARSRRSLPPG